MSVPPNTLVWQPWVVVAICAVLSNILWLYAYDKAKQNSSLPRGEAE